MLESLKQEFKNLKSPLYRNSIYISASSIMRAISGFIFWNIAARLYPPEDVGIASALISAINLIFMISLLGLDFSLIRFYPEYRERAAGSALILTLVTSVIVSMMYALIMGRSESLRGIFSTKFLLLFMLFSMTATAYNIFALHAIAKRRAEHSFVQSILFAVRFLFLFTLVSLGAVGVVSAFGLGLALGVLYGLVAINDIKLKFDFEYLKASFKFSLGNYIASLANNVPNYLMPTVALKTLGEKEAAYFYIAFMVGSLVLFVPNAISTSFFVEGSYGLKDMRRTLKKVVTFSYLYLTIATVFVWLFGKFILGFFGEEYVAGFGLLKLMILGGFFAIPVNFSISLLNIQKMVREVVVINALRAIMFLGLSYLLMSRLGIEGIGWGWIGGYSVLCGFILLIRRSILFGTIKA